MNTQQKIEAIREACIKVNQNCEHDHWPRNVDQPDRICRLADVLLAIKEKEPVEFTDKHLFVNCWGIFYFFTGSFKSGTDAFCEYGQLGWNLHKDDLTLQEPATIDFIHSVLKK